MGAPGQFFHLNPEKFTITQGSGSCSSSGWLQNDLSIVAFGWDRECPPHRRSSYTVRHTHFQEYRESICTIRSGMCDFAHRGEVYSPFTSSKKGEHDRPDLNRRVGTLKFSGDAVGARYLRKNYCLVEITLKVDQSRNIQISAYIPRFDETIAEVLERDKFHPLEGHCEKFARKLDKELREVSQA